MWGKKATYMGRMVMEPPFVVQDRVIGMVQFQQMLKSSRGLLRGRVYLVGLDRRDVDLLTAAAEQVSGDREREGQHGQAVGDGLKMG